MDKRDREHPPQRETLAADSNDGAEITSPDAEPLYTRQSDDEREHTQLELEALHPLPGTPDELLEGLTRSVEAGGLLSYPLAEQFGALGHCDRCGRPMIQAPALAVALSHEYHLGEEESAAFEDAIRRSSLELGDEFSPNYCSYHGQITSE